MGIPNIPAPIIVLAMFVAACITVDFEESFPP